MTAPANSQNIYLNRTETFPEDDKDFTVKMTRVYSNIANAMNNREIAIYDLYEQLNGQQFFNSTNVKDLRPCYRTVYAFGAIASGGTLVIPHNVTNATLFTRIYGTARTNVPDSRPIPYASPVAVTNSMSIRVTNTDIVISLGATAPAMTSGFAVLEYLKN